ncbi:MAG: YqgE/AlgH family protein [Deltaproteobacteria bacterium]|nr:YqgE/AlgH family protein [Deltaproteobacteria bacterium]
MVLLWQHSEEGAIGFVINRALEVALPEVLATTDGLDLSDYAHTAVAWGGPVESMSATVLTTHEVSDDDGWEVIPGLYLTRSQEALDSLIRAGAPIFLTLGYAGWGEGQLDQEIEQGSWLFTDLDPAYLFEFPVEERYDRALATLGLQGTAFWLPPVEA